MNAMASQVLPLKEEHIRYASITAALDRNGRSVRVAKKWNRSESYSLAPRRETSFKLPQKCLKFKVHKIDHSLHKSLIYISIIYHQYHLII